MNGTGHLTKKKTGYLSKRKSPRCRCACGIFRVYVPAQSTTLQGGIRCDRIMASQVPGLGAYTGCSATWPAGVGRCQGNGPATSRRFPGINALLSRCFGHRDAIVAVPDKVDVANLDQVYRWQCDAHAPGGGNPFSVDLGVGLQRVEVSIEVIAAPLAERKVTSCSACLQSPLLF
jgi:hypothetical protein